MPMLSRIVLWDSCKESILISSRSTLGGSMAHMRDLNSSL